MNFNALRSAQDSLRLAPGARELGSLLWWELSSTRIDHPQLVATAQQHGLDVKYLPAEIKPVQAFRRAWRHANTKLAEGLMLRPIVENTDEIVIGLVREKPDGARKSLDYDVLARIAFSKIEEKIRSDLEHVVVVHVRELLQHHLAHTTEDVRLMMTSFMAEAGVSLREAGGVYFVLSAHQRQLDALCSVVEAIGKNRTYRLPIVDAAATRVTLSEVTQRSLGDEVLELEEELTAFNLESVRDSTLERRLEAFERLRARAGLFAHVLAFKADGLGARIASMESTIRQRLGIEPLPAPTRAKQSKPVTTKAFAADVGF